MKKDLYQIISVSLLGLSITGLTKMHIALAEISPTLISETKGVKLSEKFAGTFEEKEQEKQANTKVCRDNLLAYDGISSGVFNSQSTAVWNYDENTEVLTISSGTLIDAKLPRNIQPIKVIFEGPVFAEGTMGNFFLLQHKLESIENLFYLDTSAVIDMNNLFSGCGSLENLDINNLDTSSVTNMNSMFAGCSSLKSLDVSSLDTSITTDMRNMFADCSNLRTLDISSFDTSAVTNMLYMFGGCTNLQTLDISSFDTSAVTDMTYMFGGCTNLQTLDISNLNTSMVTSMYSMFEGCSSLQELDIRSFNMDMVASSDKMLKGMNRLKKISLGKNNRFTSSLGFEDAGSLIKDNGVYTGAWQNIGIGTEKNPKGQYVFGNELSEYDAFFIQYNGQIMADTYVLQPKRATITAHDSTIYVGESWEEKDNFDSAINDNGESIEFNQITVSGNVDTTKPGEYKVTYSSSGISKTIVVEVLENQTRVNAHDSTIYVGDKWKGEDNFDGGIDKAGNSLQYEQITVSGNVDTTKPGEYKVIYSSGISKTIVVEVLENQTRVNAHDSTIYVGDKWKGEDNFDGGTDKAGNPLQYEQIIVSGNVDTTKSGTNFVNYSYNRQTKKIVVEVKEKKDIVNNIISNNHEKKEIQKQNEVDNLIKKVLPKTGVKSNGALSILGDSLFIILIICFRKKYK